MLFSWRCGSVIMGTTFLNLQLKTRMEEISADIIPKGYTCVQTAEEWTAVFETEGDFAWGKLCKLGREISRKLKIPVLAVSFFDDDEFSMNLIGEGKTMASYQATISRNFCSGSTKWISELELSKEEAAAFRYLIKKEMAAGESIDAFSRLFGALMYSDLRMWEDKGELWHKDSEGIIREIKEEKQRTKVHNRTKANLLCEIQGLYLSMNERTGILQMVFPNEHGDFLYHHVHCLKTEDSGFSEIYDFQYPPDIFRKDSKDLIMDYEQGKIRIMDVEGYCREYDLKQYERILTSLMQIPEDNHKRRDKSPEIISVYTNHAIEQRRYEYFAWNIGTCGGEIRKVDLETSGKIFSEKNILAVYQYEDPDLDKAFWECGNKIPVITSNEIVNLRLQYIKEPSNTLCDVRFFDRNLNLLRREIIDLHADANQFDVSCQYTYCEKTDCIYLGNRKIDLKTGEIMLGMNEIKEADRLFIHYNAENNGFLYAMKGSYVYVLDLDMKLLSCHRLKGRILYFFINGKGNVCLITIGDSVRAFGWPDKKSAVRLYEIDPK